MSKQLKVTLLVLLVLIATVIVTGLLIFPRYGASTDQPPPVHAGTRAEQLQAVLKGANRIEVRPIDFDHDGEPADTVVISDAQAIAGFVSRLDFNDEDSGFHCMCYGDTSVKFFQGDSLLATLSHHHGHSVRWDDGPWEGDSLFTPATAELWREWFKDQGAPRFDAMYQQAVAYAKREQVNADRFLAAFKPEARPIFSEVSFRELQDAEEAGGYALSPSAKKLYALYDDKGELAVAMSKALGAHSANGVSSGSWSQSSSKEGLILHAATALQSSDFKQALDHEDQEVQLGAARLYFFEKLYGLIPEEDRPRYAVKLCKAVLGHDRSGNTDLALRSVRHYESDLVMELYEGVVSGEIVIAHETTGWDDDPTGQFAALIFLAGRDPERAKSYLPMLDTEAKGRASNQAAVRIARAFCGEVGVLDESIFEFSSYTIGFGALKALEKEGTKRTLGVMITAGTEASWAAVREESVLAIERMTGKQWYMSRKNERAEWHGKDIRQWWAENKDTFEMPDR